LKTSVVTSAEIKNSIRLDASAYDPRVLNYARQLLKYPSRTTLDTLAHIWMPNRFKRFHVDSGEYGVPFLTASEIILANPPEDKFISKSVHYKDFPQLIPAKNTILITRSGSIGYCALVVDYLAKFAVSEDAIRVEVRSEEHIGYLYAFLTSALGKTLITRDIYGSVIDHIEPFHLQNLQVPLLPRGVIIQISQKVVHAWEKRNRANLILNHAQSSFEEILGLPKINPKKHYSEQGKNVFRVTNKKLALRLDASSYNPPGILAKDNLLNRSDCKKLGGVTTRLFHPFRMNMVFVEKDYGKPFLVGGDIVNYRYLGDKYISSATIGYDDYLLEKGWVLLTRSGTSGKLGYVSRANSGGAASEHIIRIVPNEKKILPGYLYICLQSSYSQHQMENMIYGSIVDAIRESQLSDLLLPIPDFSIQKIFHDAVEEAFSLRDDANDLEDEAKFILMSHLGIQDIS